MKKLSFLAAIFFLFTAQVAFSTEPTEADKWLNTAVQNLDREAMFRALDAGAKPQNYEYFRSLVLNNRIDLLDLLVYFGADIKNQPLLNVLVTDCYKNLPLPTKKDLAIQLIQRGVSANIASAYSDYCEAQRLPLELMLSVKQLDWFEILSQAPGFAIDSYDGFGETTLQYAVKQESLEYVKFLSERGASWKVKGRDSLLTILHLAVQGKNSALIQYIVQTDPSLLNELDREGRSAIFYAIKKYYEKESMEIVNLLIAAGANPQAAGDPWQLPIMLAAANNFKELSKIFFSGFDKEKFGVYAIKLALESGNNSLAQFFLQEGMNGEGTFTLDRGASGKKYKLIDWIFSYSMKNRVLSALQFLAVNKVNMDYETASQHWWNALRSGDGGGGIVAAFIKGGIDVNRKNEYKKYPLDEAAGSYNYSAKTIRLLLENGAQTDSAENLLFNIARQPMAEMPALASLVIQKFNFTKLIYQNIVSSIDMASYMKESSVVYCMLIELFLKNGLDPNTITHAGSYNEVSLLARAVELEYQEMIQLLLKYRVDPNVSFKKGNSLFFVKTKAVMELLLSAGGNPNSIADGTPLLHAMMTASRSYKQETLEIVKILLAAGADMNALDKQKRTPVQLAQTLDKDLSTPLILILCTSGAKDAYCKP